jgi:hypothetical protein
VNTTGISEMLLAVLEPYAGKLARTVLRGPRFREETWLPSNQRMGCLRSMNPVKEGLHNSFSERRPFTFCAASALRICLDVNRAVFCAVPGDAC